MEKKQIFDSKVQELRNKVLREVAKRAWNDTLLETVLDIPKTIVPGKTPTMRCCVYKERAILSERVKLAMGGDKNFSQVIDVLDIACDECPAAGYEVTDSCRGCLAHHCEDACHFSAITFTEGRMAKIDKNQCRECGACARVCPYSAIVNRKRPCLVSCKVKAISIGDDNAAQIDEKKCTSCGSCIYQCPFGAIGEKSQIIEAVRILKGSCLYGKYKTYAIVAPAIASQFQYAEPGQVITGITRLGFDYVREVAMGAELTAKEETEELQKKGKLLSSCCPAFVSLVKNEFPDLVPYISETPSPMVLTARAIKKEHPNAKVIFIGPCTAKKQERELEKVKKDVDCVLTFEELQAMFDGLDVDITALPPTVLSDAGEKGRGFSSSGGVASAIQKTLSENGTDFAFSPIACDGLEACRIALIKLQKGMLSENFVEGMACVGGCVGGAGCLNHHKNR